MTNERLQYLFDRYTSRTYTPEEKQELAVLGLLPINQDEIKRLLEALWEKTALSETMPENKGDLILEKILKQTAMPVKQAKLSVMKLYWKRIAVAASILLVIGAGTYLFFANRKSAGETSEREIVLHDLKPPTTNRATVTLANGTTLYLDSTANGKLVVQGNTKLEKLGDGQIAYRPNAHPGNEIVYNVLTNPRGSRVINITLADGTKVWLNAESTLRYPTEFTGNTRVVEMSGEGYFEVAHNAAMPFTVKKGNVEIKVLGTHFNVNAYDDENSIKVTLLEGAVRVGSGYREALLKPGQQALLTAGKLDIVNDADLEEVMAWKNGYFSFKGVDLNIIMRELSRWYDFRVTYQQKIEDRFYVEMDRNTNVSNVFRILEGAGGVHFKIEGENIIVLP